MDVSLRDTHQFRNEINNGKAISREVMGKYDMPIIASTLKLYLLELPGVYWKPIDFVYCNTNFDARFSCFWSSL